MVPSLGDRWGGGEEEEEEAGGKRKERWQKEKTDHQNEKGEGRSSFTSQETSEKHQRSSLSLNLCCTTVGGQNCYLEFIDQETEAVQD